MSYSISQVSFLRVFRFLKLCRLLRTFELMYDLKYLHVLLACITGSLQSFLWSVVMLFSVYGIFALIFMHLIASHIETSGEAIDETVFSEPFGSVWDSIGTLFSVTTGGADWQDTCDIVSMTGPFGRLVFILFILFVHLNLLNIIMGVFVHSAMKVLSADPVEAAHEHVRKEREQSWVLANLCKVVDPDGSGKLTREQFENGMRRKGIPELLSMLGLKKHNIIEFFASLARASRDRGDDGQVDIPTFVNGCMMLKGAGTNFDLQKMQAELTVAHAKIIHLLYKITDRRRVVESN